MKDWTDALQKLCDKIAHENPDHIHLVVKYIGWDESPYFGEEDEMIDNQRKHQVGKTGIYVRCNLSANNTKSLCDGLTSLFGYGPVTVILR